MNLQPEPLPRESSRAISARNSLYIEEMLYQALVTLGPGEGGLGGPAAALRMGESLSTPVCEHYGVTPTPLPRR